MPALYRKYRPRTFNDVLGQEHIVATLRNQVAQNRLSHAYLFVGTRGTGKTSCAKILARAVNCENPKSGEPCNACESCLSIESGASTDVLELDAASNNGVDNVRELREEAVFTPAQQKYRVYIVDEVHMLSASAFNALLKILEEPPAHVIFILATTEFHKLPATIVSRCQRYSFRRLEDVYIRELLSRVASQENFTLEEKACALLSRLADGSMRDALSLLDQCAGSGAVTEQTVRDVTGLARHDGALDMTRALRDRDASRALMLLDELYAAGAVIDALFDETAQILRDAMVYGLAPKEERLLSGVATVRDVAELSGSIARERIIWLVDNIAKLRASFTRGSGDRVAAEIALASFADERSGGVETLIPRVAELEKRVEDMTRGGIAVVAAPQYAPPVAEVAEIADVDYGGEDYGDEDDDVPPWADDGDADDDEYDGTPLPGQVSFFDEPDGADDTYAEETPEPQSESVAQNGGWDEILRRIRANDPGAISAQLEGRTAEIDGNLLTIFADEGDFALTMLSDEWVTAEIRKAAEEVLGRTVTVRVKAREARQSLDDLMQFGIVDFK